MARACWELLTAYGAWEKPSVFRTSRGTNNRCTSCRGEVSTVSLVTVGIEEARYLVVQHVLEGEVKLLALENAVDESNRDIERAAVVVNLGRRRGEGRLLVHEILQAGLGLQWRRRIEVRRLEREGCLRRWRILETRPPAATP